MPHAPGKYSRSAPALALLLCAAALLAAANPAAAQTPARKSFFPMVRAGENVTSGVLKVSHNPITTGATAVVNWNIASFKTGEVDKGDGLGFKGPISATATLNIGPIGQARVLGLRWQDAANKWWIEFVTLGTTSTPIGVDGVLSAGPNPVANGGTAIAAWNISNFKSGEFDKGDGQGYKGPIAASMSNVDVPGVTTARTLRLRWRNVQDVQFEDTLSLGVTSGGGGPDDRVCTPGGTNWRGPTYPFCVSQDLEWEHNSSVMRVAQGADKVITMKWNVYGIDGIRLKIEPNSQWCGPAGSGGRDVAVNGSNGTANATYTFNARDFGYGGYKLELFVTKGNTTYGHNEKFLCVGN